jgi:hypothetical protein
VGAHNDQIRSLLLAVLDDAAGNVALGCGMGVGFNDEAGRSQLSRQFFEVGIGLGDAREVALAMDGGGSAPFDDVQQPDGRLLRRGETLDSREDTLGEA